MILCLQNQELEVIKSEIKQEARNLITVKNKNNYHDDFFSTDELQRSQKSKQLNHYMNNLNQGFDLQYQPYQHQTGRINSRNFAPNMPYANTQDDYLTDTFVQQPFQRNKYRSSSNQIEPSGNPESVRIPTVRAGAFPLINRANTVALQADPQEEALEDNMSQPPVQLTNAHEQLAQQDNISQSDFEFLSSVLQQNHRNDLQKANREIDRREKQMKLRLSKALTEAEKSKVVDQMEIDRQRAQERLDKIATRYDEKYQELVERARY